MVSLLNDLPLPSLSSLFNTKPANGLAAAFCSTVQETFKAKLSGITALGWSSTIWSFLCLISKQDCEHFPSLHWPSSHGAAAGWDAQENQWQGRQTLFLWHLNTLKTWAPKYIMFSHRLWLLCLMAHPYRDCTEAAQWKGAETASMVALTSCKAHAKLAEYLPFLVKPYWFFFPCEVMALVIIVIISFKSVCYKWGT